MRKIQMIVSRVKFQQNTNSNRNIQKRKPPVFGNGTPKVIARQVTQEPAREGLIRGIFGFLKTLTKGPEPLVQNSPQESLRSVRVLPQKPETVKAGMTQKDSTVIDSDVMEKAWEKLQKNEGHFYEDTAASLNMIISDLEVEGKPLGNNRIFDISRTYYASDNANVVRINEQVITQHASSGEHRVVSATNHHGPMDLDNAAWDLGNALKSVIKGLTEK